MTERTPIEILAAAARLLRANATAPRVEGSPGLLWQDEDCARDNCPCNEPMMRPDLGLAVADWLEVVVGEMRIWAADPDCASWNAALVTARRVLGAEG